MQILYKTRKLAMLALLRETEAELGALMVSALDQTAAHGAEAAKPTTLEAMRLFQLLQNRRAMFASNFGAMDSEPANV